MNRETQRARYASSLTGRSTIQGGINSGRKTETGSSFDQVWYCRELESGMLHACFSTVLCISKALALFLQPPLSCSRVRKPWRDLVERCQDRSQPTEFALLALVNSNVEQLRPASELLHHGSQTQRHYSKCSPAVVGFRLAAENFSRRNVCSQRGDSNGGHIRGLSSSVPC